MIGTNVATISGALAKIAGLGYLQYEDGAPTPLYFGFSMAEFMAAFDSDSYVPGPPGSNLFSVGEVVSQNLIPYAMAGIKGASDAIDATNTIVTGHTSSLASQASSISSLNSSVSSHSFSLSSQAASISSLNSSVSANSSSISTINTALAALPSSYLAQTISSEGNLGTLTWSGTAPSGTISKKYRWSQTGKIVTIDWLVKASTPGLLVASLSVPLPGDAPAPSPLSNVVNDSWVAMGAGSILAAANANILGGQAGLYKNSGGSYELRNTTTVSLSASVAQGQVQYLTA